METIDPHVVQAVSISVAAAAMIVLGQSKSLLKVRPVERCSSCRRLLRAGQRCSRCG